MIEFTEKVLLYLQGLRLGKKLNMTVDTLSRILDVIGYRISLTPKEGRENHFKIA